MADALILNAGGLLLAPSGKLAASLDCCCPDLCGGTCTTAPPDQLQIDLAGLADAAGSTCPGLAAMLNGSYSRDREYGGCNYPDELHTLTGLPSGCGLVTYGKIPWYTVQAWLADHVITAVLSVGYTWFGASTFIAGLTFRHPLPSTETFDCAALDEEPIPFSASNGLAASYFDWSAMTAAATAIVP